VVRAEPSETSRKAPRSPWAPLVRVFQDGLPGAVPALSREQRAQAEVERAAFVLRSGTLLLALIAPILAIYYLWLGAGELAVSTGVATAAVAANYALVRWTKRVVLACHVAAGILLAFFVQVTLLLDGISGPGAAWLGLMPLLAALVGGLRSLAAWSALSFAAGVLVWYGPRFGLAPRNVLGEALHGAPALVNLATTLVATTGLSAAFLVVQRAAERRLHAALAAIGQEKALLEQVRRAGDAASAAGGVDEALRSALRALTADAAWAGGRVVLYEVDFAQLQTTFAIGDGHTLPARSSALDEARRQATRQLRATWTQPDASTPRILVAPVVVEETTFALIELAAAPGYTPDQRAASALDVLGRQLGSAVRRKQAEQQMRQLAFIDPLTGLPNRQRMLELVDRALRRAQNDEHPLALLFVDLDGFKQVNDGYGHATGDRFLMEVAARIERVVRPGDHVGRGRERTRLGDVSRFGGDEFVVLLQDAATREEAGSVASRLIAAVREPLRLAAGTISPDASVGIATFPEDGADASTLIRRADAAMYAAKRAGKGCWRFYEPQLDAELQRDLELENELRGALSDGRFALRFQPVVSAKDRLLTRLEVELFFRRSSGETAAAGEVLAGLGRAGLSQRVTDWMIDAACEQLRGWRDLGFEPPLLTLHVDGAALHDHHIGDAFERALRRWGVAPRELELAVLGPALAETDARSWEVVERFRRMGFALCLDDFGSGYSSLDHLRRHVFDRVKLHRSLLGGLRESPLDERVLEGLLALAHRLDLPVTADGVDGAEQAEIATRAGVAELQGAWVSPPLEPDAIGAWLKPETPADE
jgi:diguanylate cyclase (GGDEF)-like protein